MKYFLILVLTLLTACADPTYLAPSDMTGQNQLQNVGSCKLQFNNSGICLDWKWERFQIDKTSRGIFLVKTYRLNKADSSPVLIDLPVNPIIKLSMPGMPHGAPPVSVEQVDTGTYRASNVYFNMTGVWAFNFKIIENGEVVDEASFNTNITF